MSDQPLASFRRPETTPRVRPSDPTPEGHNDGWTVDQTALTTAASVECEPIQDPPNDAERQCCATCDILTHLTAYLALKPSNPPVSALLYLSVASSLHSVLAVLAPHLMHPLPLLLPPLPSGMSHLLMADLGWFPRYQSVRLVLDWQADRQ